MDDIRAKLVELYEGTPVLVAAYDGFDRLQYANPAFRTAFFLEPYETPFWPDLMRRNFLARRGTVLRHPDFEDWLTSTLARRGKVRFRAFETDLVDGRWLWMTETVQSDGWMLCIASDISTVRADERHVRQERDSALKAAFTDELTGAANRRFTMGRIDDMVQDAQGPSPGCFVILDLDHFKMVNDRFGHQAGDAVLKHFAGLILGQVRRTDCFGRLGGEEFGLVLPHTSPDEAELIVERMLALVRMSRPLKDRPAFSYSFSAGIAAAQPDGSVSDLWARADTALYHAKRCGRSRVAREGAWADISASG